MDLRQYARVLRTHRLLIAFSVLMFTAAAAAAAWAKTPMYAAHTQLFVSTGSVAADLSQAYQGGLFSQQRVLSYAQIVDSPAVTTGVISTLGLRTTPEELSRQISAEAPLNTVLIDVTVEDTSPQRAKAIADAVSERFSSFVNTLETRAGDSNSPVKVSITRRAQLPTHPVSPQKELYLAVGAFIGLVLGIGAAALREALNDRIRDEDDAATIALAPVLGSIAKARKADRRPLVVVDDPDGFRAEAFRRLRTNLRLSVDQGSRSFVISSPVGGEGKTLIAANLGIAFAQAGYRVVLVDANLRRPKLAEVLGLSSPVGLTNVLEDNLPVETALQTWSDRLPLEVLGSGPPPANAGELLGSQNFAMALGVLMKRADVVFLDAPALLSVADAAILARVASGVILVARVASTRRNQLETAMQLLRAADTQVFGVVLNRVKSAGRGHTSAQIIYPSREYHPETLRTATAATERVERLAAPR